MQPATFHAKKVTQGVVSYLKRSDQLHLLPQVAREALKTARAHTDDNLAQITSAVPLSTQSVQDLQQTVTHLFARNLTFDFHTDPSLIGGLVIKVGDQIIDQSLNSQINQLMEKVNV